MLADSAYACSPERASVFWWDRPISVNDDGSFTGAGDNAYESIEGNRFFDLAAGRTGQKVIYGEPCGAQETLIFVDCRIGEALSINGLPQSVEVDGVRVTPTAGGVLSTSISRIQPPHGALNWSVVDTVADAVSVATEHGYRFNVNVAEEIAKMSSWNRFDVFGGCKLFYPDSAGAQL